LKLALESIAESLIKTRMPFGHEDKEIEALSDHAMVT
jgi:hypothetical protein